MVVEKVFMLSPIEILALLSLLQLKHLLIDWCWQPEYEWRNKGIYGHLGGVRHALKNAIGTGLCFMFFFPSVFIVLTVIIIDGLLHYHIDWAKMSINSKYNLGPLTSDNFWRLTGLDQFLHQVTYLGLILMVLTL